MFEPTLLQGKRILITGGGTGLGASMARRFAELGARLVLCGRRPQMLDETAEALRSELRAQVDTIPCDVRDPAAVDAMMDDIWRTGPIDVLVNNAAATFIAQTEKLSSRAVDAVLGVTLHGAVYCTLGAGRRWIEGGHKGVVLSILSTSTRTGRAFTVPSSIAKSGLLAMTRSLGVEWGPKGIRTVAIEPGPFPTRATATQLMTGVRAAGRGPAATNPLGRVGEHIELANLAAYLVSDQAGYINGESVAIDGGAHLRTSGAEDLLSWTEEQWEQTRRK
ncbi:MAG TPA: SDR family oxidoreductase [Quisquiliibacterium sp.]|nr:SDR family oxidoreductase [Quisquiliibacterium sp.]HQN13339.1 SDR family oxidoreductase [Quisquiliibacterium sp.]